MPNHCANSLKLTATTPAATAMLATIRDELTKEHPQIFQTIDPCPQELLDTPAGPKDPDENLKIEKYGYANWYDFAKARWGTKWNAYEINTLHDEGNTLTLQFDTAWSPPIEIYTTLHAMGFDVEATFVECGCDFVGFWQNGNDHVESLNLQEDDWLNDEFLTDFFKQFDIDHHPAHFGG
jgi:hypothetical protein